MQFLAWAMGPLRGLGRSNLEPDQRPQGPDHPKPTSSGVRSFRFQPCSLPVTHIPCTIFCLPTIYSPPAIYAFGACIFTWLGL